MPKKASSSGSRPRSPTMSPDGKRRTPWMALLMTTHKKLKAGQPKTTFKQSMKKASAMKAAFDREFGDRTPAAADLAAFVNKHL